METGGGGASGGSYKWNRKGIIARMAGLPGRRARQRFGAVVREHLHLNLITNYKLGTNRGQITPPSIRWLLIMVKLQYLPLVAVLRSASLLRIAVCQIAPLPALLVPAPKERLFSLRYVGDASHTLHYVRS